MSRGREGVDGTVSRRGSTWRGDDEGTRSAPRNECEPIGRHRVIPLYMYRLADDVKAP